MMNRLQEGADVGLQQCIIDSNDLDQGVMHNISKFIDNKEVDRN